MVNVLQMLLQDLATFESGKVRKQKTKQIASVQIFSHNEAVEHQIGQRCPKWQAFLWKHFYYEQDSSTHFQNLRNSVFCERNFQIKFENASWTAASIFMIKHFKIIYWFK